MIWRIATIIISVLIILSLVLTGCTKSTDNVNWTLNTEEASHKTWQIEALDNFAEAVAKRTDGNFDIRVTIAGEMGVKREDIPMLLSQGTQMQMGYLAHGHIAGTIPHLGIYSLPFLIGGKKGVVEDSRTVEKAIRDMTKRELNKMNIDIALSYPSNAVQLISSKPIEDVSDLKNLKVRAWDEQTSNIVKGIKGVPVVMPISETYTAMQRGVVDGVLTGAPTGMVPMALQEVGKYLYLLELAPAFIYVGYNTKAFDSLPSDYQKVLREEWANAQAASEKAGAGADEEAFKVMKAAGVEIVRPPSDQMDRVKAALKPQWQEWANRGAMQKEAYDLVMKAFGY